MAHADLYVTDNPETASFIRRLDVHPSRYQQDVLDWLVTGEGHAVVGAVAGSGKSTLLKMLARYVAHLGTRGVPIPGVTGRARVGAVAFNTSIVKELTEKLKPYGATVTTMHSHGFAALRDHWDGPRLFVYKDGRKFNEILRDYLDDADLKPDESKKAWKALRKLVDLVRVNLIDWHDPDAVLDICDHHGIETGDWLELLPSIMAAGQRRLEEMGQVDFADMLYQPVAMNAAFPRFDIFLVDEAQDLNRVQQEIAMRSIEGTGRAVFVGDAAQAIYGFAGADAQSFANIATRASATKLPLSITYRCPSSHVAVAAAVRPGIQAAPGAAPGVIRQIPVEHLDTVLEDGDLVVSRINAPLIKITIRLIAQQVNARMRGRDIGGQLVSILTGLEKAKGFKFENVEDAIEEWARAKCKVLRKRKSSESRIESVEDQANALRACVEAYPECESVKELGERIAGLFADKGAAIWLSSVHRAKGLEANRVCIVAGEKMPLDFPNQMPWESDQELNILYVAVTRSMKELVFAGAIPHPIKAVVREQMREQGTLADASPAAFVSKGDAPSGTVQPVAPKEAVERLARPAPLFDALDDGAAPTVRPASPVEIVGGLVEQGNHRVEAARRLFPDGMSRADREAFVADAPTPRNVAPARPARPASPAERPERHTEAVAAPTRGGSPAPEARTFDIPKDGWWVPVADACEQARDGDRIETRTPEAEAFALRLLGYTGKAVQVGAAA